MTNTFCTTTCVASKNYGGYPSTGDNPYFGNPTNRGTILGGGTIKSTYAVWNTPTMASMGSKEFTNYSWPVTGGGEIGCYNCITGAVTPFPKLGQFMMVKYTTKIAGSTNNALLFGGSAKNAASGLHPYPKSFVTLLIGGAIRSGDWNIFSGVFTPALSGATTTYAVDSGANPTYQIPGMLVYNFGTRVPHTSNYQRRTD